MMRPPEHRAESAGLSPSSIDIESPSILIPYLREHRLIESGDIPVIEILQGGVSNRTVLVEPLSKPAFVMKQALAKLRVAVDWYSDPGRIHREALALCFLEKIAPPSTITPLLFEDADAHIIAMEAVPRGHSNWKTMLLQEGPRHEHVLMFAHVLATIHIRSNANADALTDTFCDRTWFESLRLEPYYEYSAKQIPEAGAFLNELLEETRAIQLALVHGDYSPKNILIHNDRFVLLDHEVAHFGDPAFDLGFSLTHLLSKAHHCSQNRLMFLNAAKLYVSRYLELVRDCPFIEGFEPRACSHTLACLLSRVVGRSPLEYLTETEKRNQRLVAVSLMARRPSEFAQLIDLFEKELECLS
jgi:aminoglycoside phosphotransferase (APT) family kinase protein